MTSTGRPRTAASPAAILRGALVSPWPELRHAAGLVIELAYRQPPASHATPPRLSHKHAAAMLGVSPRSLRRLRALLTPSPEST